MSDHLITVNGQPFFGRAEEQRQFRAALEALLRPLPEETTPHVMLIYGDGGIGKTTLTRRFLDIVCTEFRSQFQALWINWEDERRRSPQLQVGREHIGAEEIFATLHAVAVRQGWGAQFTRYQSAMKARAEIEQKAAEALLPTGERDDLAEVRNLGAAIIAKLIRAAMPIVGDPGENLVKAFAAAGIKGGAEGIAHVRSLVTARLKAKLTPDELELFLNTQERLAGALAHGFRKVAESRPLIVFLDTYEIVDRADSWQRLVMQEAGSRVMWIVAGRNNLLRSRQFGSEYFKGYTEDFLQHLIAYDVRQLAINDIADYFHFAAPDRLLAPAEIEAISRATRGIPLAVREAADMWKAGLALADIVHDIADGSPGEQIVRTMTERYQLHCVSNEGDRRLLCALALARGNVTLLRAMLAPSGEQDWSLDTELRRLERNYASVHREYARLHEEAEAFFIEYMRAPLRRTEAWLQQFVQRALDTIQIQVDQLNEDLPRIEDRCEDEEWNQAVISLTDLLFWKDERLAWRWLVPRFVESQAYNQKMSRSLVKIVSTWETWLRAGGRKRAEILLAAENLLSESDVVLLEELVHLEQLEWLAGEGEHERHVILLLLQGDIFYACDKYRESLRSYEQAILQLPENTRKLKQLVAGASSKLAVKLMYPQGEPLGIYSKEAHRLLEQVVAITPNDHQVWYYLGFVLSKGGYYEESVNAYQKAIMIYPDVAWPYRGLGFSYLGLARYNDALSAFQKSIQITRGCDAYIGLGHTYRVLRLYEESAEAFKQAIILDEMRIRPFLHKDIGRVYLILERYDEAIDAYKVAVSLNSRDGISHAYLSVAYKIIDRPKDSVEHQEIGRELICLDSEYNQACFEAILGNIDEALRLLSLALERNQVSPDWACRDPDFDFIRDDPRFKVVLER